MERTEIQDLAAAAAQALRELAEAVKTEDDAEAAVRALLAEHRVVEAVAGVLDTAANAILDASPKPNDEGDHWPYVDRADMVGGAGSQIRSAVRGLA